MKPGSECQRLRCSTAGQHTDDAPHTVQCAHCKEHDQMVKVGPEREGGSPYWTVVGHALPPHGRYMEEIANHLQGGGTTVHRKCWAALSAKHPELLMALRACTCGKPAVTPPENSTHANIPLCASCKAMVVP